MNTLALVFTLVGDSKGWSSLNYSSDIVQSLQSQLERRDLPARLHVLPLQVACMTLFKWQQ